MRSSSSPEHPRKPALHGENHPNVTAPEQAAPQRGEIAAICRCPRCIRTQSNLRHCCFIRLHLCDTEELHIISSPRWTGEGLCHAARSQLLPVPWFAMETNLHPKTFLSPVPFGPRSSCFASFQ